jgi:hypothetical protein
LIMNRLRFLACNLLRKWVTRRSRMQPPDNGKPM